MATLPAPTLPDNLTVMLLKEATGRLDQLAAAISSGNAARRNREKARIDEVLEALCDSSPDDGPYGMTYRTVARIALLAVAYNDAARCREGAALLEAVSRRHGPRPERRTAMDQLLNR